MNNPEVREIEFPSAVVAADHIVSRTRIAEALRSAGFSGVEETDLAGAGAKAGADTGLIVVSWFENPESAYLLTMQALEHRNAVLAMVDASQRSLERAMAAGSDAVAAFPEDLNRIHMAARLALGKAQLRQSLLEANHRLADERRQINARIRSIIHDLKNPLTVTMGNLQVIQSTIPDSGSDALGRMVLNALRGCKTQLNMMTNLSDLVKLEEGRYHLNLEVFDPLPVVENKLNETAALDTRKSITISRDGSCAVVTDRTLFGRVIQNVLGHCLHYTHDGDIIRVETKIIRNSTQFAIVISDNGERLPPELGEGIFECGYRALDDRGRGRWDRGMMLAFSRLAMRYMGGDATLDQIRETGVSFRLTLPCKNP